VGTRDPDLVRRRTLLGLAAIGLTACDTCDARRPAALSPDGPWRAFDFDRGEGAPEGERALVFAPEGSGSWPVVVALHGRGESGRGLDAGARGFRDDYGIERVHERLRRPPLTKADLQDLATDARLGELNASLAKAAYEGVRLACPYTPDLADRSLEGARPFARFVTGALLPRVTGGPLDRKRTGIDGVSMGGRLALFVGLSSPATFGVVGALQPAIRVGEADAIAALAKAALAQGPLALRLASSEEDPFLPAVRALSARLDAVGVPHRLVVTPGPHDYVWNQGPGSAELLMFQERAARGLPLP
jgi:dienelactone hydrolase